MIAFRKTKSFTITPSLGNISTVVREVGMQLSAWKVKSANRMEAMMTMEDLLVNIAGAVGEEVLVGIRLVKSYQKVYLRLSYKGEEILSDIGDEELENMVADGNFNPEAENVVRNIFLRATSKRVESRSSKGITTISILVEHNDNAMLVNTAISIMAAVIVGLTLRNTLLPDTVNTIATNAFLPLYTIFIRCIQIIMAPLVFFSMASSMMGFSDFGALGRLGGKVIGSYLITTVAALALAFGLDAVIDPGSMGGINIPVSDTSLTVTEFSLLDSLINIVPDNFMNAFVRSDMLQIIFLAILTGTAAGRLGKHSERFMGIIEMFSTFFETITATVTKILPLAVFGAIGNLVMTVSLEGAGPILVWAGETMLGLALMIVVYCILLLIFTGENPLLFFRHYSRAIITSLSTASSSGSMPSALSCCHKMGISPRIYSFSIPLGSTINMHGFCITLATATFFLAKLYSIPIDTQFVTTFIVLAVLISMAAPGVPGAGQAIMLVVLNQMGIPEAGFLLIVGIIPLLDNFITCVNVTGDGCVTTLVANSEGLLDKNAYTEKQKI